MRLGNKIKEVNLNKTCSIHQKGEICIQNFSDKA